MTRERRRGRCRNRRRGTGDEAGNGVSGEIRVGVATLEDAAPAGNEAFLEGKSV